MFEKTSPEACAFLDELSSQYGDDFAIKLELIHPGTAFAKVSLSFEAVALLEKDPLFIAHSIGACSKIYWKPTQEFYLADLVIGYQENALGGELSIEIPQLKKSAHHVDLIDQIREYFAQEIQPALDLHRGFAKVCGVTPAHELIIEFSGGCQGCSKASQTLKYMITQNIQKHFPQISAVIDSTDHSQGRNPYA